MEVIEWIQFLAGMVLLLLGLLIFLIQMIGVFRFRGYARHRLLSAGTDRDAGI